MRSECPFTFRTCERTLANERARRCPLQTWTLTLETFESVKRTLVERTQKLLASEDSRAAIEEVKAIQQQWRTVGLVPRDEDQRLWEEFRQHCDAIFQKRQQESTD